MAVTVTRTSSDLFGHPGSLASISNTTPVTSTPLSLITGGIIEATIFTEIVTTATVPSLITVTYLVSLDGTNYLQDGPSISFVPTAAATTYWYTYYPPDSAQSVQVQIAIGSAVAITALVQGATLAVS